MTYIGKRRLPSIGIYIGGPESLAFPTVRSFLCWAIRRPSHIFRMIKSLFKSVFQWLMLRVIMVIAFLGHKST